MAVNANTAVSDTVSKPSRGSPEPSDTSGATPIAASVSEAPAILQTKSDTIVDQWFSTTFPGSVLAQSTENWNFLCAAREELKKFLNQSL